MRAHSTVQQLLCHGSYYQLILSLARTSCRLLFTAHPTACPLAGDPLHDVVHSRNPSKSTLAHDAVATAVLHKHHPIIRVGAGLIRFVYRSHLRLATEATRNRNAFSPFFVRVSQSKRRAIGIYLPERICYMFLISKYRGDQDLGLCTTSILAFGEPERNGKIQGSKSFDVGKIRFCDCAAVLQTQVSKLCTALDPGLLYILILGTYSKFARKNDFLSLGVCFPQLCSSAGRRFATPRTRVQNYRQIVSFPQQKIR